MRRLVISTFTGLLPAACGGSEAPADEAPAPVAEETTEPEIPEPVIDPTGEACGGIAAPQCPTGFYCQQEPGQCLEVMDGAGTCQSIPEACTEEYAPVCGCDGQTYSNACKAAASGVSVAIDGECASPDTN